MVAAATTSLPERAEAGRNYDYRYVWIRDQCYAGIAVAAAGAYPLLDAAVSFVAARLIEDGDQMAPAYTTTGGPVPDQTHLNLPGYPGGFDLIGNWVNQQFQLDAYGEALHLFAAAARADRLDTEHWTAAETAATAIAHRWTEPDAGIWEIEPRAWTHSRLTAAGGLRAIAAAHPAPGQAADWIALADHDHRRHLRPRPAPRRALATLPRRPSPRRRPVAARPAGSRSARRSPHRRHPARLPAGSHRRRLRLPLPPRPATPGRRRRLLPALRIPHRPRPAPTTATRSPRGAGTNAPAPPPDPPELFSEEYDATQHQMRGNLPQAFVHALMIETSTRLAT